MQYCRVKNKADRSLEIYKFYVNSLYVAITRAINQVYFVEDTLNHKIFELLDLNANSELTGIEQHESTIDEWQQEVVRLELQGKKAQADAIKVVILHNKPVPWQIITKEALLLLQQQALGQIPNKQSQLLLFEYAFIYEENQLLYELSKVKFAPSINLDRKKSLMLLERKYFIGYAGSNLAIVLQQINLYGINFRNQFNQTPLMVASYFGNVGLVKELSNKGADINLVDNNGHNAWQIALNKALSDRLFAKNKLGSLEPLLNSGELDLQVDAKLVKLGKWHMEFFLVNAMMAVIEPNIYDTMDHSIF